MAAEVWIATHEAVWYHGRGIVLAITLAQDQCLLGAIGLTINPHDRAAELGYWIGVPFWGHGYCSEAAGTMIDFGFVVLPIDRVHAHHFERNPASGRVMQKAGMVEEFFKPRGIEKRGVCEDVRGYAITREQWEIRRFGRSTG
jgi:RimJ/RimL family protein N-acetyltransferase